MLTSLDRLGLEVKYVDRAREFYEGRLGLDPVRTGETAVAYSVGETTLLLRRPTAVPRGGLHTHYAFATPPAEYDEWFADLSDLDPDEHTFGAYSSLYVDDPDDHCVEIGGAGDDGDESDGDGSNGERSLTGIFEVVLEVEDVARSEEFYTALGFEVVDRGNERRRVRLRGPFDLELWEPQLGLADARGGVHVDLALGVENPADAVDAVRDWVDDPIVLDGNDQRRSEGDRSSGGERGSDENSLRVRDPDCHVVTFTSN